MRRKVISVMCILMASLMCLTGCTIAGHEVSIGGGNNDETPSEETIAPELESVVTGNVYQIDDVINAVYVVSADPNKVASRIVFLQNGIEPVESIVCTEAGEYSIDVIIEYDDTTSWGGTFTYTVEGKDVLAAFPESVVQKILNGKWEVSNVSDSITYSRNKEADSLNSNVEWLTEGDLTETSRIIESLTAVKNMALEVVGTEMPEGSEPTYTLFGKEYDWLNAETAPTIVEWTFQLILENLSSVTVDTDFVVYDIDGNTYPVKKNYIVNILKDGTVQKFEEFYWVKGPNGEVLLNSGNINAEPIDTNVAIEGLEVKVMPESYDAFKALVNGVYAGDFITFTETPTELSGYFENIMFGDITALLPEEVGTPEVSETDASGEPESPVETEEPKEPEELTADSIVKGITPHEKRFPKLFQKSIASKTGYTYTRWNLYLDENSSYSGAVLDKYGNKIDIGIRKEKDPDEVIVSGWGSSIDGDKAVEEVAQYFDLETTKGNYRITNEADKQQSVMTSLSSNSKVVCRVHNDVIYVTIANKSAIDNLVKNCTFDSTLFADDTTQEIWRYNSDVNELGNVEYYKIRYTDVADGVEMTAGYIATVNVDDQYILVLPDQPVDMKTLEHVCMNMIKRVE